MAKRRYYDNEVSSENPFYSEERIEEIAHIAASPRKVVLPVREQAEVIPQSRVGAGRPKVVRKVERPKAMNIYLDPDTYQLLKNVKCFHGFDMKDIPYLLTREFFGKYCVDGRLASEGLQHLNRLLDEVD